MSWRALKPPGHMTPCGCETDDDSLSDEHTESNKEQSTSDFGRSHHYPVGKSPKTWCNMHRSERPCQCDRAVKSSPTKSTKGKKR